MRKDCYGKCQVKWYIDELNKKKWVCLSQLPPYTQHNEKEEKCWKYNCKGRSMNGYPLTEEEIKEREEKLRAKEEKLFKEEEKKIKKFESKNKAVCENYTCDSKISFGRKKYCSEKCQKQKARVDYRERQKIAFNKKRDEKETPPTLPVPPIPPEDDICISVVCSNKKSPRSLFYCSDNCRKRAHEQRKRGVLKR